MVCGLQAFNENPEGVASSQPRASDRSDATPWVGTKRKRGAPGGGKSNDRSLPVAAFAPSGGVSWMYRPNPGCRSLRSLALGWELVAPSGRRRTKADFKRSNKTQREVKPTARHGLWISSVQRKPRRGCKHTAQGKRAKRCDTLGLHEAQTRRPRRGQKQ